MLIFVIFLHFGLKIMSLSAAPTTTDTASTHICADFNYTTGKTTVKWAVSSQVPVAVSDCELIYREVGNNNPAQLMQSLQSHGSLTLDILQEPAVWKIQVTCTLDNLQSLPSPQIQFIPGNGSSAHVCSNSRLDSLVPNGKDVPVVLCIWRPEPSQNYTVIRWQPTSTASPSTRCALHTEAKGQAYYYPGLPIDDMQYYSLKKIIRSARVTCNATNGIFVSANATNIYGASSACSVDLLAGSPTTPSPSWDGRPTGSLPPIDAPSIHRLGISNMALGLSLAASILIAAVILTVGLVRWLRWQGRRRRERLLRHGEPAADQSAMDEFQQMV